MKASAFFLSVKKRAYKHLLYTFSNIDLHYSVDTILTHISLNRGISASRLQMHITSSRFLNHLTPSQSMVCILNAVYQVSEIADLMQLSRKTIYSLIAEATQRMGLKSITHLCFYITSEFTSHELHRLVIRAEILREKRTGYRPCRLFQSHIRSNRLHRHFAINKTFLLHQV